MAAAERLHHLVEVVADGDLVVEEVLEPDEVHPLGHGDEREQVAEADADVRLGQLLGDLLRRRIEAESRGHDGTSVSSRGSAQSTRIDPGGPPA